MKPSMDSGKEEEIGDDNPQQKQNQEGPKGKSCKGYLYYSSTLKSHNRNPRCIGVPRTLHQGYHFLINYFFNLPGFYLRLVHFKDFICFTIVRFNSFTIYIACNNLECSGDSLKFLVLVHFLVVRSFDID